MATRIVTRPVGPECHGTPFPGFITAEPWGQPAERWVFVESEGHGNAVSQPIRLQILPGE
ncbi:MAG: hypothetical protein KDA87_21990 [Planctomycetales bacterium]|nr:hypothetical protein [Planctomycetales bacterium]